MVQVCVMSFLTWAPLDSGRSNAESTISEAVVSMFLTVQHSTRFSAVTACSCRDWRCWITERVCCRAGRVRKIPAPSHIDSFSCLHTAAGSDVPVKYLPKPVPLALHLGRIVVPAVDCRFPCSLSCPFSKYLRFSEGIPPEAVGPVNASGNFPAGKKSCSRLWNNQAGCEGHP